MLKIILLLCCLQLFCASTSQYVIIQATEIDSYKKNLSDDTKIIKQDTLISADGSKMIKIFYNNSRQ
jgi:hypothetical protein